FCEAFEFRLNSRAHLGGWAGRGHARHAGADHEHFASQAVITHGQLSFRQSRFPQAIHNPGTVLRAAKWWQKLAEIGNAKRGIELAQPPHDLPRFCKPSGQRVACRHGAQSSRHIWLVSQSPFRPRSRLVIASGTKMSECDGVLPREHAWIE